jgi:uncharacterized 2Fe-2S/4Fe-4S cluster protein (DUF4445 family)
LQFTIDFEPIGRRGQFKDGQSLLECAQNLSIELVSLCGGMGACGHCKVQVIEGKVSPPTAEERSALSDYEIQQGYRLACLTYPRSDVKLNIPVESMTAKQRTQVEGINVYIDIDPIVQGIELQLTKPTFNSPLTDVQNVCHTLSSQGITIEKVDFRVQQVLSRVIRENDWSICVAIRDKEIIAVSSPSTRWLGLAVDIGTTKIAGYLIDLESGKTLASKGLMNPQISYGEDVVSRIVAASKSPENTAKLQNLLTDAIHQLSIDLCAEIDLRPSEIVEAVIVGNTAIHHLFLGLPVKQLGLSPFIPVTDDTTDIKARDIGLQIAPGAYIHMLPNIASYVGADHVAMLLATRITERNGVTLAIDIGTNTEICLNNNGIMTSVSCASGPAFEGAHIKFGMRAAPGAIEHFRFNPKNLEIQTIGNQPPIGICGSGLLDIVAELHANQIIEKSGKLTHHPLVQKNDGKAEFILVPRLEAEDITLSQKDVRELQLAKAAIRLGIEALLDAQGLIEADLDQVIIAGAFGTFIDIQSAITIGMLPDLPTEIFTQVGNAAGTGARMALISKAERDNANKIAQRVGYIELAKIPNFGRKFALATNFGS